ncbi:unnamed protein product [Nezara viridula]|uniref:Uncharacterized protein n=1 Tax=Nezara viridula TaxID=85310 RepID=A0A9P0MQP8_NEZVI|nr:unnamed protein product [Nezara viridula]
MDPSRRTGRRQRGRLVRSERVVESHPQFTAWDVFIRDSLLQIAWPISLSSDNETADALVKSRLVPYHHIKYSNNYKETCFDNIQKSPGLTLKMRILVSNLASL